jgi:hypothetical protein
MGISTEVNWVYKITAFYKDNMHTEIKWMITTPYTAGRSVDLKYQSPCIIHEGEWRGEIHFSLFWFLTG